MKPFTLCPYCLVNTETSLPQVLAYYHSQARPSRSFEQKRNRLKSRRELAPFQEMHISSQPVSQRHMSPFLNNNSSSQFGLMSELGVPLLTKKMVRVASPSAHLAWWKVRCRTPCRAFVELFPSLQHKVGFFSVKQGCWLYTWPQKHP